MKHASAIHAVPITSILVRDRHRRDMGDLAALAESIDRDGLLQPIGITEKNQLVFGERRLRAVRDVLCREKIDARVIRLESILTGEYAENELRKEFTPSERVEIAKAVKSEMGRGRGGDRRSDQFQKIGNENTDDAAAAKAGFGNPETYRQAQRVVDRGTPELTAAMDSGELSVSAASKVATQPRAEQNRILDLPKPERKEVIKNLAPSPAKAREIAIKTGKPVAASNNTYVLPMSASDQRKLGDEQLLTGTIYNAIKLIANTGVSPDRMIELGRKHYCRDLAELADQACDWLGAVLKEFANGKAKRIS